MRGAAAFFVPLPFTFSPDCGIIILYTYDHFTGIVKRGLFLMDFYLKAGGAFTVPSIVADHLLGLASHAQLKVLLYVLAHADSALTESQIAAACKVEPENIAEALDFWQQVNVLTRRQETPGDNGSPESP